MKNAWEPRIDQLIQLFVRRMTERAERGESVVISDKVAYGNPMYEPVCLRFLY